MFQSVTISNFQSHEESSLEFIDGVNVIIGPSDAGKSAVFRSINWVLTNRPLGDGFRSEWGGETSVKLETTDGREVIRGKSDAVNCYIVNGNELKAFGSNPPEDVEQALQIDEVNIQSQTDPPFLLVNSPGEAAQILNKAASIDDIDLANRNLKSAHDRINREIKSGDQWLTDQQEQLKQYDNLNDLEAQVERAEYLEQERNNLSTALNKLTQQVRKVEAVNKELEKTENLKTAEEHYEQAKKHQTQEQEIQSKVKKIESLVNEIQRVEKALAKTKRLKAAEKYCRQAEQSKEQKEEIENKAEVISRAVSQIQKTEGQIEKLGDEIESKEQEYNELAPKRCPLCGNQMEGKNETDK